MFSFNKFDACLRNSRELVCESKGSLRVILVLNSEMKRSEIQNILEFKSDDYFRVNYIIPSLEGESIEMIYPESHNTHNNDIG